ETITVYNQKIIVLYDPPHLIKGIRNNFLVKNIEINVKSSTTRELASWDIIETAYQIDTHSLTLNRQLRKLTDEHVIKNKIKKMKVKLATQVFSFVDTDIGLLKIPQKEGFVTAKVLDFFNKLFDFVNKLQYTPASCCNKKSQHHTFWNNAIKFLHDMRFVNKTTKKPIFTPSLKNWITTVKGFKKIWALVNKAGIKCLKTGYINQDPLENFFGLIRSHNRRNVNPTCANFESSFKTLLINNLTGKRTVGGNCEIDNNGEALFSLRHFVENSIEIRHTSNLDVEELAEINNTSISVQNKSANTDNYKIVTKKLLSICSSCKETILLKDTERAVNIAFTTCENKMSSVCFRTNISKKLSAIIEEHIIFSYFKCAEHKQDFATIFLQVIIEYFSIPQWCSNINKILKGRSEDEEISKEMGNKLLVEDESEEEKEEGGKRAWAK
ncbi:Uncharacterized protein DBV15_12521, partial [Temnothorax longispinosus]